jgi:hypothetical protein
LSALAQTANRIRLGTVDRIRELNDTPGFTHSSAGSRLDQPKVITSMEAF